jgi:hypothetical protein
VVRPTSGPVATTCALVNAAHLLGIGMTVLMHCVPFFSCISSLFSPHFSLDNSFGTQLDVPFPFTIHSVVLHVNLPDQYELEFLPVVD